MADIKITKNHSLEPAELRARVEGVVEEMKSKLGFSGSWKGDTCTMSGKGIKKCEIRLAPSTLSFELDLGMMFKVMKGPIEKQIEERVSKIVGA